MTQAFVGMRPNMLDVLDGNHTTWLHSQVDLTTFIYRTV